MKWCFYLIALRLLIPSSYAQNSDTIIYNKVDKLKKEGQFEKAVSLLNDLLAKANTSKDSSYIFGEIGFIYNSKRDFHKSLSYIHKAIKTQLVYTDSLDQKNAYLYINLSFAYAGTKNYKKAIQYTQLANKTGYNYPFITNNKLGFYYSRLNQRDSALHYYKKALKIKPVPGILTNIGDIYLQKNQPEKALKYFKQAQTKPNLHVYTSVSIKYRLSKTYRALGKHYQALKLLQQADSQLIIRSKQVLTQSDKLSIARWVTAIAQLGLDIAYQAKQKECAFYFSERLKMGIVLEKIAKDKGILPIATLQKRIGAREKLIAYAQTSKNLYAFVIGRTDFEMYRLSTTLTSLKKNIEAFQQSIAQVDPRMFVQPSVQLYNSLIAPLLPRLKYTTKLVIIPSLSLNNLPFGALAPQSPSVMSADGFRALPYLIRRFEISYYPSASLLFASQAKQKNYPLDFTGVAYTQFGTGKKELIWGEKEVQYAYNLFTRKKLYSNSFPNNLTLDTRIFHISTHGFYDEHEVLGGLELGTNDTLTVNNIYAQSIRADLAVLSGCQSGMGQPITGEGIIGLPRALLYAGVRNIIATQFFLSDRATYRLMIMFYYNVKKGYTYRQALTYAKRVYINQYPFPARWGALVLIGK
ncbi:hypothetical protein BKI52_02520 [marine bacterium AO1-C]|nr:hypothetical protein BKI52_02520 [marine bacterium AO1-C]